MLIFQICSYNLISAEFWTFRPEALDVQGYKVKTIWMMSIKKEKFLHRI